VSARKARSGHTLQPHRHGNIICCCCCSCAAGAVGGGYGVISPWLIGLRLDMSLLGDAKQLSLIWHRWDFDHPGRTEPVRRLFVSRNSGAGCVSLRRPPPPQPPVAACRWARFLIAVARRRPTDIGNEVIWNDSSTPFADRRRSIWQLSDLRRHFLAN